MEMFCALIAFCECNPPTKFGVHLWELIYLLLQSNGYIYSPWSAIQWTKWTPAHIVNNASVCVNSMYLSSCSIIWPAVFSTPDTVLCRYNVVNILQNPHIKHPITCLWGRDMGCFCDHKIWFTFCHSCRSILCNMWKIWPCYNGTWLYKELQMGRGYTEIPSVYNSTTWMIISWANPTFRLKLEYMWNQIHLAA